MLKQGDKIALVCCSNGLDQGERETVILLKQRIEELGLVPVESPYIYQKESVLSGSGKERAEALEGCYRNSDVKAIFDISGGDVANEVLSYLDFSVIREYTKPFFGYSDLTTVLNAIYTMTGHFSGLYQIRNLVGSHGERQIREFCHTFMTTNLEETGDLCKFDYHFLHGTSMRGIVVGGNMRCLLKLAGTPFWPDLKGKILFLESNGGEVPQMMTYVNQLRQMGIFKEVAGILLGTFTRMEKKGRTPTVDAMILEAVKTEETPGTEIPVAKTSEIGHGSDSKCLMIGAELSL
ncbi:MAG: LD-carboxypeptidase [Clostridium sp.]